MSRDNPPPHLLVIGVHLKSEGYPNTLYRLRDLENSQRFRVAEINVPMRNENTQNYRGFSRLTRIVWQAAKAHVMVVARYLIIEKRPERMYVPYPAVFILFLFSWFPKQSRPRHVVADVFISLYDTIVNDRHLIKRSGLFARILRWVEERAYLYADKLVVDTPQSKKFLCSLFNLPEARIISIPLSTNETHFKYAPYLPSKGVCHVLFIGTMVPLHGIKTILDAADLLSERQDIRIKLIGDGQDASIVEEHLSANKAYLSWERAWQSSGKVAEEICRADICLGIFGPGDKAQRVCPLKIYAYASIGRAIITGETDWLKEATSSLAYEPFSSTPVSDASALAAKIIQLADDPMLRSKLASKSHEFYQTYLINAHALEELTDCLLG